MLRFTIRDVLWLTVVVALGIVLGKDDHAKRQAEQNVADLSKRFDDAQWKLGALVKLIERRDGQVELGDNSVSLYIVAKQWSAGPGWSSLERN